VRLITLLLATVFAVCAVSQAQAHDRWESGSIPVLSNDDAASSTRNQLRAGDRQEGHDLEGTPASPDRDFYIFQGDLYHSYEAIVRSGTLFWGSGNAFCVPPGGTSVCPRFDLVLADGTLIKEGAPDGAVNNSNVVSALRIPFTGTGQTTYLRVTGDTGGSTHTSADQYDIEVHDTTYSVPRFNNSATQTTVLLLQNTSNRVVSASPQLFDENGSHLITAGQNIAPRGVWVLPLASIGAAQGKSGSILIFNDGAYGALTGKAVSLEPATGFTFDTAVVPFR
jgi:hypothetical protein